MAKKKTSKRRGSAPVTSLGARGKKAAAVKGGAFLTSVGSPRGVDPPEPDRLRIGMTDPPEPDRLR
jgi:hypothetical protein